MTILSMTSHLILVLSIPAFMLLSYCSCFKIIEHDDDRDGKLISYIIMPLALLGLIAVSFILSEYNGVRFGDTFGIVSFVISLATVSVAALTWLVTYNHYKESRVRNFFDEESPRYDHVTTGRHKTRSYENDE